MAPAPIRLKAFPRHRLLAQELFACPANEVDLIVALGDPTAEYQPSLGEGTPILFWDLEWPCGLVTGLQFDPLAQRVSGFLDQPEVSHALRHLGLDPDELWILERDEPTRFTQVCPDPPIRSAHLWRIDDDGLEVEVAAGLTEREARCLADARVEAEPGARYEVREGAVPERQPSSSPPPSEPPRIRDRRDLFDEMLEDDPDAGPGGAADHVREALVRRTAQAVGRDAAAPSDDAAPAEGMPSTGASAPSRPARRKDLFR